MREGGASWAGLKGWQLHGKSRLRGDCSCWHRLLTRPCPLPPSPASAGCEEGYDLDESIPPKCVPSKT